MNAIILSAGLGSRFKERTKSKHKSLFEINGIPNIERTVIYLYEAGIKDIHIVTGYLSEQFSYLKSKYNCHLIYNDKYKEYNNIYSFYLAKKFFGDSYVIDSDVVLFKNIFLERLNYSTYFTIQRKKSSSLEWNPILDNNYFVKEVSITSEYIPSLLGVSFWKINDANIIISLLKNYIKEDVLSNPELYWDNIPIKLLGKLKVKTKKISIYDGYEIDNLEDLDFVINELIKK